MRARHPVLISALMLLIASGCDWPQFGSNPAHTRFSGDTDVKSTNAATAVVDWTAGVSPGNPVSPSVAGGVAYLPSLDRIDAFDADGVDNCVGTPGDCSPLWSYLLGDFTSSSPAIVDGVLYTATRDEGMVYAFDAKGVTNCSGSPAECDPLWTAATGGAIFSSPTVADGKVYVTSRDGKLYVFDAAGTTSCTGSPTVCSPLWTATTGGPIESSPAVANGKVYFGSDDSVVYAFDAAGVTNCSAPPITCTPLFTSIDFGNHPIPSSPAVARGKVYIGVAGGVGDLFAFDAEGVTNCTAGVCEPLFASSTFFAVGTSDPAVSGRRVFVGSGDGLYAFDSDGIQGCSGTPTTCEPRWVGNAGDTLAKSAAVVNDVVYIGSEDNHVYGFNTAVSNLCSGAPLRCNPLWTTPTNSIIGSPIVAMGRVYAKSGGTGTFYAWKPQTPP